MAYKIPINKRFWSKVKKTKTCWEWIGCLNNKGYGNVSYNGKSNKAHRVSYEIIYGPIPNGMCVLHHCDNPRCVKPSHLFIGTQLDNIRDRVQKNRNGDFKGTKNKSAILKETQVLKIRKERRNGIPVKILANEFNVSIGTIQDIIYRRTWSHI